MLEEIEFMKQREIERIQQLDLDDIDLISHSSNIGKANCKHSHYNLNPYSSLRPKPGQKEHLKAKPNSSQT